MSTSTSEATAGGGAPSIGVRNEHDLLGNLDVPRRPTTGCTPSGRPRTSRSPASPSQMYPIFIGALAAVKQAAAQANRDIGALEPAKADAIIAATQDIRAGALHDQFIVDMIQGGAGTSTNMNANEVIANRGPGTPGAPARRVPVPASAAGRQPGAEHQRRLPDRRQPRPRRLHRQARRRAGDAARVLPAQGRRVRRRDQDGPHPAAGRRADDPRAGVRRLRHHPGRGPGPAAGGPAAAARAEPGRHRDRHRAQRPPRVPARRRSPSSAEITGIPTLVSALDLVEATSDVGVFVQLSGVLKRVAVKLSKTCNDLRLLSSGPRAGFNEINLPARQAGSSIMPGKVNPVIPGGGQPGRLRGDRQ